MFVPDACAPSQSQPQCTVSLPFSLRYRSFTPDRLMFFTQEPDAHNVCSTLNENLSDSPLFGFVQERRSEQSLASEALNQLVPHHCHIIRDGKQTHLLANEVVPGDRIRADLHILTASDLEIDESSLTGETTARRKDVAPCAEGTEMAERASIAYMGTLVRNGTCYHASVGNLLTINLAGRGSGVAIATGS